MIEYSLFRIKFIKPYQTSFLHTELSPREILLKALEQKPSVEPKSGYIWHIGNIQFFAENTGYFAIGRTTHSSIEKFDAESGNFIEEATETSPYTHVVFDASIGLIGIAKKTSLASSAKGIASKIERLFSETPVVLENKITVEVSPIPNPDGFLKLIARAYRVTRFMATFRGPNPFDADERFQKPLSVYLSAIQGEKGKAIVQGVNLDKDTIEAVARSTAATGNEASAQIIRTKTQRPITVHLNGDAVKRTYDEDRHEPEKVLNELQAIYSGIRYNENR